MHSNEWALIFFTILAQMSVGSFLVLGIIHNIAVRKAGLEEADRLSDRALLAIGPVLVLGLLASLFHLGTPMNAYRTLANLGSSWLSMEILSGSLFAASGGLFAIMQWRKIGPSWLRFGIAWVAALIGLWLVASMSKVYMLRTVPPWNTWATPLSFFTTTFLLGALAAGAALVANYAYIRSKDPTHADVQGELLMAAVRCISVTSMVLLGVEFVIIPLHIAYMAADPAVASLAMVMEHYGLVFASRLILVFIGAGIFGIFLYRYALSPGREATMGALIYPAFAFVLASELMGRFLFYASYTNLGL